MREASQILGDLTRNDPINITGMRIPIHVAETRLEGRVSQNFDIGLSFCFILCRRLNFEKTNKKSQKLPVFCSKIKTRT